MDIRLYKYHAMIAVMLVVVVFNIVALYFLYLHSFEEKKEQLKEGVVNQAVLISELIKQDAVALTKEGLQKVLSQVDGAYLSYNDDEEREQYSVVVVDGGDLQVVAGAEKGMEVEEGGLLSTVMKHAVLEEQGTMMVEHNGMELLATYAYIPSIGVAVIAEVELAAIRRPYVWAAIIKFITVFFVLAPAVVYGFRKIDGLLDAVIEKEKHISLLLDSSDEAVYGIDKNGDCTFANLACAKMLLVNSPKKLLGKNMHTFMHHHYANGEQYPFEECRIYKALVEGVKSCASDEVFWRQDGSSFPVEYRSYPIESSGEIQGAVVMFNDLTEERQLQEELKSRNQLLAEAQNLAKVGSWELDITNNQLLWSDEVYRIFEINKKGFEVSYEAFIKAVHPDDRDKVKHAYAQSLENRMPYEIEHRLLMDDGRVKNVVERCETFYTNDSPVRSIGIMQDVTERKMIERKIKKYYEELELRIKERTVELEYAKNSAENASKYKSEFLGRMSHELRTPLNAIMGFSQILGMEEMDDVHKEFVGEIGRAGGHLLNLINEVLDLAKIETGNIDVNLKNICLCEIVETSLIMLGSLAGEKSAVIINEIGRDSKIAVLADSLRMKEVLNNLISNAIKYNEVGGRVTISASEVEGDFIRINVADTGPGLSEEQREMIFEPFNRLGAEYSDAEGTGIGLTIAKQLVETMGGRIGINSALGEGATFWVELPRGDYDEKKDSTAQVEGNSGEIDVDVDVDVGPYKVLYVEDNPSNLKLVKHLLRQRQGIEVFTSSDGKSGIEMAERYLPDLIILDIGLPDISGYEVLKRLKNSEATKHIPVYALTAEAMSGDAERGLEAGFQHYLTKPINLLEFNKTIASAMKAPAA